MRPGLRRFGVTPLLAVSGVFGVHAIVRFGGLWDPLFIPLSRIMIWPLPWLVATRAGRRDLGFGPPVSWAWVGMGPVIALGVLMLCAAGAWGLFGETESNWFIHHARTLREPLTQMPPDATWLLQFGVVTLPAVLFSPLAEEFLYRGFILGVVGAEWGRGVGMTVQACAFAFVHLAHYGLMPLQPLLLSVWIPSMAGAALAFGWITVRSRSIWCAVGAHAVFNAGMNACVFLLLPDVLGTAKPMCP